MKASVTIKDSGTKFGLGSLIALDAGDGPMEFIRADTVLVNQDGTLTLTGEHGFFEPETDEPIVIDG